MGDKNRFGVHISIVFRVTPVDSNPAHNSFWNSFWCLAIEPKEVGMVELWKVLKSGTNQGDNGAFWTWHPWSPIHEGATWCASLHPWENGRNGV